MVKTKSRKKHICKPSIPYGYHCGKCGKSLMRQEESFTERKIEEFDKKFRLDTEYWYKLATRLLEFKSFIKSALQQYKQTILKRLPKKIGFEKMDKLGINMRLGFNECLDQVIKVIKSMD